MNSSSKEKVGGFVCSPNVVGNPWTLAFVGAPPWHLTSSSKTQILWMQILNPLNDYLQWKVWVSNLKKASIKFTQGPGSLLTRGLTLLIRLGNFSNPNSVRISIYWTWGGSWTTSSCSYNCLPTRASDLIHLSSWKKQALNLWRPRPPLMRYLARHSGLGPGYNYFWFLIFFV
jgi:hypothetical protein